VLFPQEVLHGFHTPLSKTKQLVTSYAFGCHFWYIQHSHRIIWNTCKFDQGLGYFRRSDLHWPDVVDRVRFRVCVQVSAQHGSRISLSASSSPVFLVAATCDRLTAVTWTSLMSDWLHTADVHLLTLAHQTGTHFLPTSETIVSLSLNVQTPP